MNRYGEILALVVCQRTFENHDTFTADDPYLHCAGFLNSELIFLHFRNFCTFSERRNLFL